MAQTLRITIKVDQVGSEIIDQINDKIKRLSDSLKTVASTPVIPPQSKTPQANNQVKIGVDTAKMEEAINRINGSVRTMFTELDRSIDEVPKRMDKVFDNIFVGLDNLFTFGRRLRLNIGAFFGDSRATITLILNDLVKILKVALPGLAKSTDFLGRLENQSESVFSKGKFSALNSILGKSKLPLLVEIRVFFQEIRMFFYEGLKQLRVISEIIRFVFGVTNKEFDALHARVVDDGAKFRNSVSSIRSQVFDVFHYVEKKSGLLSKIFSALGFIILAPFKILFATIKGVFSLIGGVFSAGKGLFNLLTGRNKKPVEEKPETTNEKILRLQELRVKRSEQLMQVEQAFAKQLVENETYLRDFQRLAVRASADAMNSMASAIDHLKKAIVGLSDSFKLAFNSGNLRLFNNELEVARKKLEQITTPASRPKKATEKVNLPVPKIEIPKEVKSELDKQIDGLLSFESILQRKMEGKKGVFFGRTREFFIRFVTGAFDNSLIREFSQEHFNKIFKTIFSNLGIKGDIQVPKGLVNNISTQIRKTIELAGKEGITGKDTGNIFAKALAKSAGGKAGKELEDSVRKSMAGIQDVLKKSLLSGRLTQSGKEIAKQVGQGLASAKKEVAQATEAMTGEIKDRLPSSPAKIGALRRLPTSGSLIPQQVAQGILSKITVLTEAANMMANVIFAPINFVSEKIKSTFNGIVDSVKETMQEANKIGDISNSSGVDVGTINKLDALFKEVGQSATDNQMIFSRAQQTLNQNNKEMEQKLAGIGINLEQIRESGDPVLSLFMSVSNALNSTSVGTEKAKIALEALGLTADNVLVGVLRRGGTEMQELIDKSAVFSNSLNPQVIEVSQELRSVFANLKKIFSALKNDFVGEVLPEILDVAKKVREFFIENAVSIRTFFIKAGQLLANLIRVTFSFFALVKKEPGKAAQIASQIFFALVDLVKRVIRSATKTITDNISNEVKFKSLAALEGLKNAVFTILSLIGEQLDLRLAKLLLLIESSITEVDGILSGLGNSFLEMTGKVAGRWIKIALAVVKELWVSIKNFFLDVKDGWVIMFLEVKSSFLETVKSALSDSTIVNLIPGLDVGNLTKSLDATLKTTRKEITDISEIIAKRNDTPGFIERAMEGVRIVGEEIGSVDEQLDEINEKIAQSNNKLLHELGKNFTDAFSHANVLIEQAQKATTGLFDKKAMEEYNKALQEAKDKIVSAVEGTELAEPIKKLMDQLAATYIEKLDEVGKKAQETLALQEQEESFDVLKPRQRKEGEKGGFLDDFLNLRPSFELTDFGEKLVKVGEAVGETWGGLGSVFSDFYEITGKKIKAFAVLAKATAIGEAITNVAVGVTKALSTLPPPLSYIQAGITSAQGMIQVAKIRAQGFAFGGLVNQGTSERADDVMIRVSKGEFVIPAERVRQYGYGFFENLRLGKVPQQAVANLYSNLPSRGSFKDGGSPRRQSVPVMQGGGNSTTIVNVVDRALLEQFLATPEGQKAVVNVIAKNSRDVKRVLG